jgi:hypothetical protein
MSTITIANRPKPAQAAISSERPAIVSIPGPEDIVFAAVVLMVLVGGRIGLFNDPGTPWHLRLGRDILSTGHVPAHDTLTFTRDQAPWVDQAWGFDVLLAAVVDSCGWPMVIALVTLGLAWLYSAVARGLIADGASPISALTAALIALSIGAIHFLIRPHLFTYGFIYLTLRACQRQHRDGGWAIAWVPLFTMILANLHGGFVALPVVVATALVGHAISGPWDQARARNVGKFGLAFVASCALALVNPYGLGLYHHVAKLLVSSGVTSLILEYQSAPFGKPEAEVLEWVIMALIALPVFSSRSLDRYHLCHVIVWLHLALTSIRNAPFFALAVAPALATLFDGLPIAIGKSWTRARAMPWPAIAACMILLAASSGVYLGGYDAHKWPLSALETLNRQPTSARLFHEQDWGGLIAAECRPPRKSYLDDRFELFGKEMMLEYLEVLTGGPNWDMLRDRDKINLVWLRPDRGLSKRLLSDPQWRVLYRDKVSILFARDASVIAAR